MRDETREKLHNLKERVIHPFGRRGHGEDESEKRVGKGTVERRGEEHKVDKTAGSEFLED